MAPGHRGFTLAELVVVIAVIILLLAVSLPALSTYFKGRSLHSAGRLFETACQQARQKAVASGRDHLVLLFAANDSGQRKFGIRLLEVGTGYLGTPTFLPGHLLLDVDDSGYLRDSGIKLYDGGTPAPGSEAYAQLAAESGDRPGILIFKGDSGDLDVTRFNDRHTTWSGQSVFDPNLEIGRLPADIPTDIKVTSRNSNKMLLIDLAASGQVRTRIVVKE